MTEKRSLFQRLTKKIQARKAKVGLIGLGYVGLPLAVSFAKEGFEVVGIDVDTKKINKLKRGHSYILDIPSNQLRQVVKEHSLKFTADYKLLSSLDVVIICVPTPLSKTKKPDVSYVVDASKKIKKFLKKGQLIILESTTYPGTTEEVVLPELEKSGLHLEKDFFLAFSPERVDPGNKQYDVVSIPKIVGGAGPLSRKVTKTLYNCVIRKVKEVSSAKTAEMVKLLENTFRSVNIGMINEIAVMCNHLGIDVWEVIEAAKTKPFGFMPFYPGPGIGGHCLPVDPLYLSWKSRLHGYEAEMIELAQAVNENMPAYVVDRAAQLLNQKGTALKGAKILVMGVGYKKDANDIRESPALDVIDLLIEQGSTVDYSDQFVPSFKIGRKRLRSKKITPSFLKTRECIIVLTDHSEVDYEMLAKHSKLILDTRNVLRKFQATNNKITFL